MNCCRTTLATIALIFGASFAVSAQEVPLGAPAPMAEPVTAPVSADVKKAPFEYNPGTGDKCTTKEFVVGTLKGNEACFNALIGKRVGENDPIMVATAGAPQITEKTNLSLTITVCGKDGDARKKIDGIVGKVNGNTVARVKGATAMEIARVCNIDIEALPVFQPK